MRLIAVPLARVRAGAPPVTTFLAQSSKKAAATAKKAATANTSSAAAPQSSSIDLKGKSPQKEDSSALTAESSTASTIKTPAQDVGEAEAAKAAPLATRLMNKASDFWIGLGREDQKSTFDWKRRTYNAGEKLMDRIEYEEWALKGVDPALGPSLKRSGEEKENGKEAQAVKEMTQNKSSPVAALNVPLLFPSSILTSTGLLNSLTRMTASRQPHHRQRLIWCIVGMPLTIPFILVPVIPNLPFFYLVWRAWSHWRALSSSKYLSELISQGRLVPTPSEELDRIMALEAPPQLSERSKDEFFSSTKATTGTQPAAKAAAGLQSDISKATTPSPASLPKEGNDSHAPPSESDADKIDYESYLLLKPHTIKALVKSFHLEHQLSVELTRARQQTIKSIQKGQMDKLEEAASGQPEHGDGV